jgi:hypothetical protein
MSITTTKTDIHELQWVNRQPEQMNYLRPSGFRFLIQGLPQVTYFCQAANIPTINLGVVTQYTPLIDIPRPGEKLQFGELTIQFLIQEDMQNYSELYNWLIGLGSPENSYQFQQRTSEQAYRDSTINTDVGPSGGGVTRKSDLVDYSDASLMVMSSNNIAVAQMNFKDCFPISLSGVDFDISNGQTQYFTASAVFKYTSFTVESLL